MKKILLTALFFIPLFATAQTVEGFDGTWTVPTGLASAGGPAGWAIVDINGPQKKWEQGTGDSYSGEHHASLQAENVAPGTTSEDWLISPALTVPANGQVSFFSKLSQAGSQGTTYRVMVKVAGGTLADQINAANYAQAVQWTETQINPVQTDWTQKSVSLIPYVGQQVYIAFVMNGDNGDSWKIDNVSVGITCVTPTNLFATNITPTSATIGWVSTPEMTSWSVEVIPVAEVPTGNGVIVNTTSYTATGLTPGADYKAYVYSVCGIGNESGWAGPFAFTLPVCDPANMCTYTFRLTDTAANSWGGNYMAVNQTGNVTTLSLDFGFEYQDVEVSLCHGVPFTLSWGIPGGSWPEEIGVEVLNAFGQSIYVKPPGTGEAGTVLYEGVANCEVIECLPPYAVTATPVGTTANVSFYGPESASYQYFITTDSLITPSASTVPTGTATSNQFSILNLSPETEYFIYVRLVFDDDTNSNWSEPGSVTMGSGNTITGTVRLNSDGNGDCSGEQDYNMPGAALLVTIEDGQPFVIFTDEEGQYMIDDIADGEGIAVTIQPIIPQLGPFEATILSVDFPAESNPVSNICLALPEEINNDVEVFVAPLSNAQAGFYSTYSVMVQNNAPVVATGVTFTLDYDNGHVALISANQPYTETDSNTIAVNLGTIAPFATTSVTFEFHILPPPTNLGGEVLVYTAAVSMDGTDTEIENNVYSLNHIVVNSFDPNDITVHEGSFVHIDQADEYLHYTIRFQNTGTAPAVNIRVENELDANLDWDTFDPIAASHYYRVTRYDGNQLEFMFPNIFLPDSTSNEPGSHGFITYRIKPKADIAINDVVSSTAGIYFDFNAPVITNTATTTFGVLSLSGNDEKHVSIYPNPVTDELHIAVSQGVLQHIEIYDLNGRLCHTAGGQDIVNAQQLSPGLYILKVHTDTGTSSFRLIKQ